MRTFLVGMVCGFLFLLFLASRRVITMVWKTADGKYLDVQEESFLERYISSRYKRTIRDAHTGEICELPLTDMTTEYVLPDQTVYFYTPKWTEVKSKHWQN